MKKIILIITFIAIAFNFANAQDDTTAILSHTTDQSLQISGYLQTNQRFFLQNDNNWAWNENRLNIELSKNTENLEFYAQVWLRNIGLPQFYQMSSLYNKGIIDPYDLELRQVYGKVKGFIIKNIDLTVGKQIITWGTADKINPTNNLNPNDFEDVLDFGRKRGVFAVNLEYYIGNNFKVQGVFEPFFTPSNLPVGVFNGLLNQSIVLPTGLNLNNFNDSLYLPTYNLKNGYSAGLKFKGSVKGVDFSLSYVYGLDNLPQPFYTKITPVDMLGNVDVMTKLDYPRQHIFGFDMSTNLFGANIWAEISAVLPQEDVVMKTDLSALYPYFSPVPEIDSTLIPSNKPYFKYVIGGDYFFPHDFYLNFQYIHGFLHERGDNELNDYYFLRLEKSFFYDKLKIVPVSGAFIVSDYKDFKNNYTWVYMPEIVYKPVSNCEITLSTAIIDGKGTSIFSKLKDFDMFSLNVKYNF